MNVRRLVSLLFLTLLLPVASEALAAGTWVLWVEDERFWDPKGEHWGRQTRNWNVLDASSSEAECRRKLGETIKRVTNPENPPKDEDMMYKVTGDAVTFVFFPKDAKPTDKLRRSQVLRYICLPDTVDPRERSERK